MDGILEVVVLAAVGPALVVVLLAAAGLRQRAHLFDVLDVGAERLTGQAAWVVHLFGVASLAVVLSAGGGRLAALASAAWAVAGTAWVLRPSWLRGPFAARRPPRLVPLILVLAGAVSCAGAVYGQRPLIALGAGIAGVATALVVALDDQDRSVPIVRTHGRPPSRLWRIRYVVGGSVALFTGLAAAVSASWFAAVVLAPSVVFAGTALRRRADRLWLTPTAVFGVGGAVVAGHHGVAVFVVVAAVAADMLTLATPADQITVPTGGST
jgi:hypothetical protein